MENTNNDCGVTSKKTPKNPIKFKLTLNEEQKAAKEQILHNTITVLKGKAGSGKTMLGCQVGLDLVFRREVDKMYIIRPAVSKEDIGFLPGDLREKMGPWMAPIIGNLHNLYNQEKITKMFNDDQIEIVPLMFMRGRTFTNALIVVDEAQNITDEQMEMVLSRLGKGSKMVLCGDTRQIDLRNKKDSGFHFLCTLEERGVSKFKVIELQTNHRNPIVDEILEVYYKKDGEI